MFQGIVSAHTFCVCSVSEQRTFANTCSCYGRITYQCALRCCCVLTVSVANRRLSLQRLPTYHHQLTCSWSNGLLPWWPRGQWLCLINTETSFNRDRLKVCHKLWIIIRILYWILPIRDVTGYVHHYGNWSHLSSWVMEKGSTHWGHYKELVSITEHWSSCKGGNDPTLIHCISAWVDKVNCMRMPSISHTKISTCSVGLLITCYRCPEMPQISVRGLFQAVRSQLHFSQLSAWWSCSKGSSPAHVNYRVTVPGEAFASQFQRQPVEHSFPVAGISRGTAVKVWMSAYWSCQLWLCFPTNICFARKTKKLCRRQWLLKDVSIICY